MRISIEPSEFYMYLKAQKYFAILNKSHLHPNVRLFLKGKLYYQSVDYLKERQQSRHQNRPLRLPQPRHILSTQGHPEVTMAHQDTMLEVKVPKKKAKKVKMVTTLTSMKSSTLNSTELRFLSSLHYGFLCLPWQKLVS